MVREKDGSDSGESMVWLGRKRGAVREKAGCG